MKRTPVEPDKKDEDKDFEVGEYDEMGKACKGGGFKKGKDGKLFKMKKSEDLSTDDLQKSLDMLEAFANEHDSVTRKEVLLQKAQTGELSDEERDELFKALGGQTTDGGTETLANRIETTMAENENLQKSLDVSDFLSEQHSELVKSLGMLADHQEQSDQRQHEFNLLLAKAVTDVGNLVKSMAESLDGALAKPAAQPKSRGVNAPAAQPMVKSFAGADPSSERMSKSAIMAGLEEIYRERLDKSGSSQLENGVDLLTEISKFESSGMLHPSVDEMVRARITQRQAH